MSYIGRLRREGLAGLLTCIAVGLVFSSAAFGALPASWSSQDVGGPGQPGSASESGGTWIVAGSGGDIWGNTDQFHYACRQVHGNFDISCRVVSFVGGDNAWRKGGLMARATLNGDSRNVAAVLSSANGIRTQSRTADGGASASGGDTGVSAPQYLRLQRTGNTFRGYRSDDGSTWVQQWTDRVVAMPDTIYVGFAVTSHNNGQTTTYTFDGLKGFPVLNDAGASVIAMTSASLDGELVEAAGATAVWAYWGLTDGGTSKSGAGAWEQVESLGLQGVGALSTGLTGLTPDTRYYYRYYASNATWNVWAPVPAMFTSLSSFSWDGDTDDMWGTAANWAATNVPDTAGESAKFGGSGDGDVDLNGNSYTIDSIDFTGGDYTLVDNGSGSLTVGALTHAAGANTFSANVSVTGTTDVSGGTLALDPVDAFSAGAVSLGGGTLEVRGTAPVTSVLTNVLAHKGYNINNDALHNLHNNGGLMATTPYGTTTLTDGPADRGLDFNNDADFLNTGVVNQNDNYMNLFIGYFVPQETGAHEFRIEQDDDVTSMWLDLDRDGVFEAPGGLDTGESIRGTGND